MDALMPPSTLCHVLFFRFYFNPKRLDMQRYSFSFSLLLIIFFLSLFSFCFMSSFVTVKHIIPPILISFPAYLFPFWCNDPPPSHFRIMRSLNAPSSKCTNDKNLLWPYSQPLGIYDVSSLFQCCARYWTFTILLSDLNGCTSTIIIVSVLATRNRAVIIFTCGVRSSLHRVLEMRIQDCVCNWSSDVFRGIVSWTTSTSGGG